MNAVSKKWQQMEVVFRDIPHSYPPATSVSCCYTLAAHFQPSPRDWVGIFKVGWSTIKDYHTFVWNLLTVSTFCCVFSPGRDVGPHGQSGGTSGAEPS
uniref:SKICH domain-containing protein n=1 Tax=Hippocampus comes TaxID=109280 RepID=A0A3Q2YMJ1_HIPCM